MDHSREKPSQSGPVEGEGQSKRFGEDHDCVIKRGDAVMDTRTKLVSTWDREREREKCQGLVVAKARSTKMEKRTWLLGFLGSKPLKFNRIISLPLVTKLFLVFNISCQGNVFSRLYFKIYKFMHARLYNKHEPRT